MGSCCSRTTKRSTERLAVPRGTVVYESESEQSKASEATRSNELSGGSNRQEESSSGSTDSVSDKSGTGDSTSEKPDRLEDDDSEWDSIVNDYRQKEEARIRKTKDDDDEWKSVVETYRAEEEKRQDDILQETFRPQNIE
mmetsp:Transcript_22888/g.25462  ORF Transcript_22888/g.25462 Transcript_22888/m.25462 type:complete len:140 (+) Transcript_22888:75-494(+)